MQFVMESSRLFTPLLPNPPCSQGQCECGDLEVEGEEEEEDGVGEEGTGVEMGISYLNQRRSTIILANIMLLAPPIEFVIAR